jgi:hypothetical protein
VKADWLEPIDPVNEDLPRPVTPIPGVPEANPLQGRADAFEVPLKNTDTSILKGLKPPPEKRRHEFGDTKYRSVNYRFVGTTRFREYFPLEEKDVTLTGEAPQLLHPEGVADASEVVQSLDMSITYTRDTDYKMDYEAGTIARTASGAIGDGQTVHVQFLPSITRTSPRITLDILNSARPAAPRVLYVIPTFGWTTTPQDTKTAKKKITSQREGRGLRVYMERPWWSSGDGELLGVVLWRAIFPAGQTPPIPDKLKPYVTQWGMDPVWLSGETKALPGLADFTLSKAEHQASGLTLEEIPGEVFSVAGHEVGFDPDRKLWYCDLVVDAGATSYFPFVRLALARYQPKSVPNAHLSRVVLADFAQLAPDRLATLTFDSKKPARVGVSVTGLSYRLSAGGMGPSQMEVCVEERIPGIEGDLGWTPVPNACFPLRPAIIRGSPIRRWSGKVRLPSPRGSRPFRLVIREFELYPFELLFGVTRQRRLVYADALEI